MTHVAVIAGGLSPERDVSIRSGRRVAEELRSVGIEADVLDIDASLLPQLTADRPSCAFPLVHGAAGEDGSLQEVLQAINLPFVGSVAASCRQTFDKSIAGSLAQAHGISVPKSVCLPQSMFRDLGAGRLLAAVVDELSLPLIVKPSRGGSALGVSVVTDADELPAAMVAAFAYGDSVLIQRYISGTEIAIAVIEGVSGLEALPAVEIVPDSGLYDYTSRYTAGMTEFFAPARLPEAVLVSAAETAMDAHRTLKLRDWSRSDLIVDEAGTVWFLEVNVSPGMTETSLVPQAIAANQQSMGAVLAALVERAVQRG
jgi:D-alanine-D-alanine ligase